jgi:predicted RNase H-like HicB family nuclease
MKRKYTPVIKEDAGLWIGWIEEIPGVKCQAQTRSELIKNLFFSIGQSRGIEL